MSLFPHDQLSLTQIILYNIVCVLGLLYIYWKSPKTGVAPLIIFMFSGGLFSDFSSYTFGSNELLNIYKSIVFIWSILLFLINLKSTNSFKKPLLFLSLFVVYFFAVSFLFHDDNLPLVLSQLSKYISPSFLTIALYEETRRDSSRQIKLYSLFQRLILLQILMAIVKLLVLGSFMEGWVGTITGVRGGGAGTSLPLLGLFWLLLVSNMKINTKRIFFAIGLLFIGIMTGKRAVIILFPLLYIFLLLFVSSYYKKVRNIQYIIPISIIVVGMFYLGLRLIPSFNPENKVWGSFDVKYAYDYTLEYSTGIDESGGDLQEGVGRVGGVLLFWNDIKSGVDIDRILFGLGNEYMAYADIDDYFNEDYYLGITSRGSVTGVIYIYFTIGLIGVLLLLLFILSWYPIIKYKRFRYFLLFTVLFDLIFYNAQMIFSIPMFTFLLFIVISANNSFDRHGDFIFYDL